MGNSDDFERYIEGSKKPKTPRKASDKSADPLARFIEGEEAQSEQAAQGKRAPKKTGNVHAQRRIQKRARQQAKARRQEIPPSEPSRPTVSPTQTAGNSTPAAGATSAAVVLFRWLTVIALIAAYLWWFVDRDVWRRYLPSFLSQQFATEAVAAEQFETASYDDRLALARMLRSGGEAAPLVATLVDRLFDAPEERRGVIYQSLFLLDPRWRYSPVAEAALNRALPPSGGSPNVAVAKHLKLAGRPSPVYLFYSDDGSERSISNDHAELIRRLDPPQNPQALLAGEFAEDGYDDLVLVLPYWPDCQLRQEFLEHYGNRLHVPHDSFDAANNLAMLRDRAAPVLATVIAALGSQDARVRANACYVLWKMGPAARPATPQLLSLLRSGNYDSKGQVLWAFTEIAPQSPMVVQELIAALHDSQQTFAFGAFHLNRPDAPQPVAKLAALGLRAIGPAAKPALPHLLQLLATGDEELANAAATAIVQIDPATASDPSFQAYLQRLQAALRADVFDDDRTWWERTKRIGTINRLGPAAILVHDDLEAAALTPMSDYSRTDLIAALEAMQPGWLLGVLQSPGPLRDVVISTYGTDNINAMTSLCQYVPELGNDALCLAPALVRQLSAEDAGIRVLAAETLEALPDDRWHEMVLAPAPPDGEDRVVLSR